LDVGRSEKFRFIKEKKFPHKKAHHEGVLDWGQNSSKGEKPKQFQSLGFKPKRNFIKKGLIWNQANPRELVSIAMKWDITPKIAPNPNWGMGVLR
jgi:hypothetical protein